MMRVVNEAAPIRLQEDERLSTEAPADAGGEGNKSTVSTGTESESDRNPTVPHTTDWARPLAGEHARRLANPLFRRARAVANSNVTAAPYNHGDFLRLARKFLLMTTATLAQEIGLSPSTLRGWRRRGEGPRWIRLSWGHLRYTLLDVEDWLEAREVALPVSARRTGIRRLYLIDPETLSDETGIPVERLQSWRRRGMGPKWVRLGRRPRYRLTDVECWLAARGVRSRGRASTGH